MIMKLFRHQISQNLCYLYDEGEIGHKNYAMMKQFRIHIIYITELGSKKNCETGHGLRDLLGC